MGFPGSSAFPDDGAVLAGHLGGAVRAVMGNDKGSDLILRVILAAKAVQKGAEDLLLIAGADQNRKAGGLSGREMLFPGEGADEVTYQQPGIEDHQEGDQDV